MKELLFSLIRAENGTRTRDPNLGKVVLYQLSYFRLSVLVREEEETRTPTSQLTLPPQSSASTNSATSPTKILNKKECPEQDSNLHASRHTHLKRARLPIPPPGQLSSGPVPHVSFCSIIRAENGTRTRDPNLGKVVLYQLSYFRLFPTLKRGISLNASAKVMLFSELTKLSTTFFQKNR